MAEKVWHEGRRAVVEVSSESCGSIETPIKVNARIEFRRAAFRIIT
jgi:hypothetical protein